MKFENNSKVEVFVKRNRRYLFVVDYFQQTAYHWAAKRGYNEMLQILVNYGSHFNQRDNVCRTPLWHAAKNNHYKACEILLEKVANPFMESQDGKRPFDITNDSNIRKLLSDYMDVKNLFF